LNPIDYSVCEILHEKVCKTHITDLDELKERLETEWAKLDHVVIAAAIRGAVAYQRVSRPVVDIMSTVSDFHYCTVC